MNENLIIMLGFTAFGIWWVADEWEVWLSLVGLIAIGFFLVWMGGL